jgi:hypothetical protein
MAKGRCRRRLDEAWPALRGKLTRSERSQRLQAVQPGAFTAVVSHSGHGSFLLVRTPRSRPMSPFSQAVSYASTIPGIGAGSYVGYMNSTR